MNRFVAFGIAIFFAVVGIALVGGERQAVAGLRKCHGCSGCSCSGKVECSSCKGRCHGRCSGKCDCSCSGKSECSCSGKCSGKCSGRRCHGRCSGKCSGCTGCTGCTGCGGEKQVPAAPEKQAPAVQKA